MSSWIRDLRYAVRVLLHRKSYALAAIVALALGIGASVAIFSVLHASLWKPLPYKNAERLAIVWEVDRVDQEFQNVVNPANYADWNEQNKVFDGMAAYVDDLSNLTGNGEPEEIVAQLVTPNFFTVLGSTAKLGRTFSAKDTELSIIVISHGFWQRRFGGDPNIIGKKILLDGKEFLVIGVMPEDFNWYIKKASFIRKPSDAWTMFPITPARRTREGRYLGTVALLKPGIDPKQAQAEMKVIGDRLEKQYPEFNTNWGVNVVPLRRQLTHEVRTALLVLSGAVGFVFLIACTNVANLVLTRAVSGTKEIALRSALGAGPFQILRQLLAESLLLSLLGGTAGLLLAIWGVDALGSIGAQYGIDFRSVKVDLPILFFTLGASLFAGIVFGLLPAIQASRWNVQEHLRETAKGVSVQRGRARNALIIAEIALALVLLTGAGLLIQSFTRLLSVNPGFNADHVLTFRMILPSRKYPEDNQRVSFYQSLIEKIKAMPEVSSVGGISFLPFAGVASGTNFEIVGRPPSRAGEEPGTEVFITNNGFFKTMQIPLKQGRWFTFAEETEQKHVVIVNESLARKYFPGEEVLGKQLIINMRDPNIPTTVVGVVGDVKNGSLDNEVSPSVYWPHPELPLTIMSLVVRTKGEPIELAPALKDLVHQLDPEQPVADFRTMNEVLGNTTIQAEFNMILMGILASVALILAIVGIYGVMSYSVLQRVQEIGVRMALGANSRDVLKLVLKQGGSLVLLGTSIGILSALALTRWMKSLLFQVSSTDLSTFAIVSFLLAVVALFACWIPARRAAKVDPLVALRSE